MPAKYQKDYILQNQKMVDRSLYERDFNLWIDKMTIAVEKRDVNALDWENLATEIECMGDSLKTQLETRVMKLIEYVLTIRYCPESNKINYYKSRAVSQQYLIKRILQRNPSLNEFIEREYPEIFDTAIVILRYLFEVPEDSFIELSEILSFKFSNQQPLGGDRVQALTSSTVEMSYDSFSFASAKTMFGLNTVEDRDAVTVVDFDAPQIDTLKSIIEENLPLATAIGTEKARSQLLIAPILVEVRKIRKKQVSLFSGTEFNVDRDLGLVGTCDFIISASPKQFALEAPVLVLVEAKQADLNLGMGQVTAEMVAAQKFNQQQDQNIPCVYGCVTSGAQWRFLRLQENTLYIDFVERNLMPLQDLISILLSCICPFTDGI